MIEWRKVEFEDSELERLPNCDLCGADSSQSKRLFKKLGLWVNRCSHCGLLYVNPRLRQEILWQRYSQEYFENEYLPIHGQYNEQANYRIHAPFLRELKQYVPGGRMFEFGAAIGLFLAAARLDGWQVAGNELSAYSADYAQRNFNLQISAGPAEDVQQTPGSYDAVTLWETIEHVRYPSRVLSKAAELLRPGGVLGLSTPNIASASYRFLGQRWWIVAPKEHIFYFDPGTMARALRGAGFRVRRIRTAAADLHYFYHTLLGQAATPAHLRHSAASEAGPASGRQSSSQWARRIGGMAASRALPVLGRAVHTARLGDQLIVYATKA